MGGIARHHLPSRLLRHEPTFRALVRPRRARGAARRSSPSGIVVWSLATIATGLVARVRGGRSSPRAPSWASARPATPPSRPPHRRGRPPRAEGRLAGHLLHGDPRRLGARLPRREAPSEHAHGWRARVLRRGRPGARLALLVPAHRRAARVTRPPAEAHKTSVSASAEARPPSPSTAASCSAHCAYTFAIGGFAYWAPTYLAAQYGIRGGAASFMFGRVTVVAGAIGTLVGGPSRDRAPQGADRRRRRRPGQPVRLRASRGARRPAGRSRPSSPRRSTCSSPGPALPDCPLPLQRTVNVAILRSVPAGLRASAMALSIFAIHLLGDLWSPPLIGVVADHAPMAWAMLACPGRVRSAAPSSGGEAGPGSGRSSAG